MLYFSYGSNMSLKRILARVPSATVVSNATLAKHQLKYHKIGKDGSGKCNIYENGKTRSDVYGVIFDIDENEKKLLDIIEGLGYGYEQKEVNVCSSSGDIVNVFTYYAIKIDENLEPFSWYLEHVARGAKENNLPKEYIRTIELTEAIEDPDQARHEKELNIYR